MTEASRPVGSLFFAHLWHYCHIGMNLAGFAGEWSVRP